MDAHDDLTRIGDAERTAALEALGEHMRAGRLDLTEYDDRVQAVTLARTPAGLAPLFADLPAPGPFAVTLTKPPARRTTGQREPWGGRAGESLVAAAPFIALIVALITGFWWAFFLVPLAGAVVWGDAKGHKHRPHRGHHPYRC